MTINLTLEQQLDQLRQQYRTASRADRALIIMRAKLLQFAIEERDKRRSQHERAGEVQMMNHLLDQPTPTDAILTKKMKHEP